MEIQPFLQGHRRSSEASSQENEDSPSILDFTRHSRFFICVFTLKVLFQFTASILELPMGQLIERAACRDYGPDVDIKPGDAACKFAAVQVRLVIVMEYKWTFDSLPRERVVTS